MVALQFDPFKFKSHSSERKSDNQHEKQYIKVPNCGILLASICQYDHERCFAFCIFSRYWVIDYQKQR